MKVTSLFSFIIFISQLILTIRTGEEANNNSIKPNENIHANFGNREEYENETIRSLGVNFNFQDTIQHLAFIIRTEKEKYFQLDLRLIGSTNEWQLLLQQDDITDRIKRKYFHPEDCYVFKFQSVKTMKDIFDLADRFIEECDLFKFFFKYVMELRTIGEWEEMLDFDHEKRLKRVNCMMFTEYFLKVVASKRTKKWIKEYVLEKGNKLLQELKY